MTKSFLPLACLGLALVACEPKETTNPDATTATEAAAAGEGD